MRRALLSVPLRPPRRTRGRQQGCLWRDAPGVPPRSCATLCPLDLRGPAGSPGLRRCRACSLGESPCAVWRPLVFGAEGVGWRGLGRDAAPPATAATAAATTAAATLWGVLSAARTPSHPRAPRERAADRPGRRWGEGCFLIPQVLASWVMGWRRGYGLFGNLKGGNTSVCVR